MHQTPSQPSEQVASEIATLDQSARLTIRLLETLNLTDLRFSERQRLTRILLRLEAVAAGVHDLLPVVASAR